MLYLDIRLPDCEGYKIDDEIVGCSLQEAFEQEADTIAFTEAGSDQLEDPSEECRQLLKQQIVEDMTRALRRPGDTYRCPMGVLYVLAEKD